MLTGIRVTTDPADVLDDPDVQIVVEMMGGEEPAHEYILRAIANGKHVVTANKEVMAKHGPSIVAAAASKGLDVAYEASVGGGIPVIGPFKLDLLANDISRVDGDHQRHDQLHHHPHEHSGPRLRDGAARGPGRSATPRPTRRNDIEGIDAAYKLAILSTLAFHARVQP